MTLDPVIARQYPLYIASAALACAIAAISPRRYAGVIWICVAQRVVETVVAAIDWHAHAIASSAFVALAALELFIAFALSIALGSDRAAMPSSGALDPRDRGLVRMLRGFGGLEIFWFLQRNPLGFDRVARRRHVMDDRVDDRIRLRLVLTPPSRFRRAPASAVLGSRRLTSVRLAAAELTLDAAELAELA